MTCPDCGTVNPTGMRFCGMCGSALGAQLVGRERRRVSTVFIDIASFSTMTRGLDPEDVRNLADEILTVVAGIIENYDGYVDAFRGDGLMALFGAPHSHADDADRAVRAAAAALDAIQQLGRDRDMTLAGRAGVTTGTVIAGAVGSGRARDYTVMGSSVNLAARLEEAAGPGEVWVGPETWETTHHGMQYESTGPIHLDGFPNVREAFRLVSETASGDGDPFGDLAFVGRAAELAALQALFDEAATLSSTRVATVVGETGIGKSRLVREFVRRLGDGARMLRIAVQPTEPFRWHPLARQVFELPEGEDRTVHATRIESQLATLLPEEPRWSRLIMASLGLAPRRTWTRLERRKVDRAVLAWSDLLASFARHEGKPVVLIVEDDAHDATLNDLLHVLHESDAPLLIVRTARERSSRGEPDSAVIALARLSPDESRELLDELASPLLQIASDALVEQVGGVPAYLLELGRALSLTGERSVSGSLSNLLQARLDMVPPGARRLLAHAAVTGERCWEGLLLELAELDGDAKIRTLVDEKLLIQQASSSLPGESEYRFQSELLRRAALRMIPFGDRPILHLRIATWLESRAPLAFSEIIADHFHQGGSDDAAFGHYVSAAHGEREEGDPGASFRFYEAIAGLSLAPLESARAALEYAEAALAAGDTARAALQLERARTHIDTAPGEGTTAIREALAGVQADLDAQRASDVDRSPT